MLDSETVEKIRSKDPEVFQALLNQFGDRLLKSAYFLCRDAVDAEDIVQEAFLQAFKSAHNFKGKSTAYTWLFGIMKNVYFNRLRRKVKEPELTDFTEMDVEDVKTKIEETKIMVVQKEVETLSPNLCQIVKLRYFDKKTVQEIAEILDISAGTVKSRLHHARKKLSEKKNILHLIGL